MTIGLAAAQGLLAGATDTTTQQAFQQRRRHRVGVKAATTERFILSTGYPTSVLPPRCSVYCLGRHEDAFSVRAREGSVSLDEATRQEAKLVPSCSKTQNPSVV